MAEKLLTVAQVAELKATPGRGKSTRTIYAAIADGRLPAEKVLGVWAVKKEDAEKYEPVARGGRPGASAKGRGGRPKGFTMSEQHRARIAKAQAQRWAERRAEKVANV